MKTKEDLLKNDYFKWLYDIILPTKRLRDRVASGKFAGWFDWLVDFKPSYDEVVALKELFRIPYIYDPARRTDEDRMIDAMDLRERFMRHFDISDQQFKAGFCTVLEMLIAMSIRCDKDIMGDPYEPELTTPLWFWSIFKNLHFRLDEMKDEEAIKASVDFRVETALKREYGYYGDGSFFPVRQPKKSMKNTDIWMQMNWWLSEKFGTKEVI